MSSAAVMIGVLRVNWYVFISVTGEKTSLFASSSERKIIKAEKR